MMASIITILLLGLLVLLSPSTFAEKGKTNIVATPHRRRLKSLPWISKKRQYYQQHNTSEADPKSPLRTDDTNNNIHAPMIVSAKSGKGSKTTKSGKGSKKHGEYNNHPSSATISIVHSKSAKVSTKSVAAGKSTKAKSSKAKVYKPYYSSVESDINVTVNEEEKEEEGEQEQSTLVVDVTPEITNSTDNIEDISNNSTKQKEVKTLYIVRHAEHERECNDDKTECDEWLRPKGIRRADELANYMKENDIINNITHVFASHRPRTYLTVLPVAEMAGVNVTIFPKDAEYSVNQVESVCPTLDSIRVAPMNSTIVVAGHGGTIYKLLSTGYTGDDYRCDGLGLDTGNNQTIYPKDDDSTLPEDEYSNLWKVSIVAEGRVKLDKHVLIDPPKLIN